MKGEERGGGARRCSKFRATIEITIPPVSLKLHDSSLRCCSDLGRDAPGMGSSPAPASASGSTSITLRPAVMVSRTGTRQGFNGRIFAFGMHDNRVPQCLAPVAIGCPGQAGRSFRATLSRPARIEEARWHAWSPGGLGPETEFERSHRIKTSQVDGAGGAGLASLGEHARAAHQRMDGPRREDGGAHDQYGALS